MAEHVTDFAITLRIETNKRTIKRTFDDLHTFKRYIVYLQETGVISEDQYKDYCSI